MDIGIDLGTTFSVIAVDGHVELDPEYGEAIYLEQCEVSIIPSPFGEPTFPSVAALGSDPDEDLYGSEAPDVARDGADLPAEVRQAVAREGALRLEDYWVRRSGRAWFEVDGGLPRLEPAADEMARLLGWNDATRDAEVEACRQLHEEGLAVARSREA